MQVEGADRMVAIGVSCGGQTVLREILRELPRDFSAVVTIVHHLSPEVPSYLDKILGEGCALPVSFAGGESMPLPGHVYIAPPDRHLVVHRGRFSLNHGPRVNLARPAIDITFRSAAVAYGNHLVGVVLTGLLDDGSSGMSAIKTCGGITMVQDPQDAEYRDMPESVLETVGADHVLPADRIAGALIRIAADPPPPPREIPPGLIAETKLTMQPMSDIAAMNSVGDQEGMSCPDCGGPLWNIKDNGPTHLRCHIGHAYSPRTLLIRQSEKAQEALWVALRTLEERTRMLERMARVEAAAGRRKSYQTWTQRAAESMAHARVLRDLLESAVN